MNYNKSYPLGKTIQRMIGNAWGQNRTIFIAFIIYTITASIYPLFAVILPKLLVGELVKGSAAAVHTVIYIVLGYFIASGCFGFIKSYILSTQYNEISKLRLDYIRDFGHKILTIDYKYCEDETFYEKNMRAFNATNSNDNGVEGTYHMLFEIPAVAGTVVILMVFIGLLNPLILLGMLVNLIAILFVKRKTAAYEYSKKEELNRAERKKNYYYDTTYDFKFGKDIRLYHLKDRILHNYNQEIDGFIRVKNMIFNKELFLGILTLITLVISDGLIYGILIYKVLNGMSIADFSMYLSAIISLSVLLKEFSDKLSTIINESQYVSDFFEFIDRDLGEKGGTVKAVENDTLEIVFDNVSFCYPDTEKYIFKNLNFTIHKGERLAIVGINGAGKSTLVKLMTGLFDVTEGEIRINGVPIHEYDKSELFHMFSVVFQDVNILAYTIKENVSCSSDHMNMDRIKAAIEKVGLKKKIESLPKQYDQMMLKIIEEDGVEFSGGESQKLAIARALYKDGNMVIMDEPTAALDALAEAEIYENFGTLIKGKTAVYISHRLASTKFCDKIALFDKDGLREYGNHEELMNLRGEYFNMFQVQGKYYNEGGAANE